jgi:hypothetical protein
MWNNRRQFQVIFIFLESDIAKVSPELAFSFELQVLNFVFLKYPIFRDVTLLQVCVWFQTFRDDLVTVCPRIEIYHIFDTETLKHEITALSRNVGNETRIDATSHPRIWVTSPTRLREPKH